MMCQFGAKTYQFGEICLSGRMTHLHGLNLLIVRPVSFCLHKCQQIRIQVVQVHALRVLLLQQKCLNNLSRARPAESPRNACHRQSHYLGNELEGIRNKHGINITHLTAWSFNKLNSFSH